MILCSRRIAKMNIEVEEKNPKLPFLYVQLHWQYKLIAAKGNGYSVSGHMQIRCNGICYLLSNNLSRVFFFPNTSQTVGPYTDRRSWLPGKPTTLKPGTSLLEDSKVWPAFCHPSGPAPSLCWHCNSQPQFWLEPRFTDLELQLWLSQAPALCPGANDWTTTDKPVSKAV